MHKEETQFQELKTAAPLEIEKRDFAEAKQQNMVWTYEGKEYPLFLADKTGNVVIPLKDGDTKLGYVGANFHWEKAEPFLNHLDMERRSVRNLDDGETQDEKRDFRRQNIKLFGDTCRDGFVIDINEDGTESPENFQSYEDMQEFPLEIRSALIDKWLGSFYIERKFEKGGSKILSLLKKNSTVSFIGKVGSRHNPAHLILFELNVPNEDERVAYDEYVYEIRRKTEQRRETTIVEIDFTRKLQYAKKHLISAQGVAVNVAPKGQEPEYKTVTDATTLKAFKDSFNPEWFMSLADALQDTFNIVGK